jgi:hypothetical protein
MKATSKKPQGASAQPNNTEDGVPRASIRKKNYLASRKKLIRAAAKRFGRAAIVFETMERFQPRVPDKPEDDSDLHANMLYEIQLTEWVKANNEIDSVEPQMFAYLEDALEDEVLDKLKTLSDWSKINQMKDIVGFLNNLEVVLLGGITGVTEVDKKQARDHYRDLRQESDEELAAFAERFVEGLDTLDGAKQPRPPETDIAADFIGGLSERKYGEMRSSVNNDARRSIKPYPKTFAEAFALAGTYEPHQPARAPKVLRINDAAFVTKVAAKKLPSDTKARGRQEEESEEEADSEDDDSEDEPEKPNARATRRTGPSSDASAGRGSKKKAAPGDPVYVYSCHLCGSTRHFLDDCPSKGLFDKAKEAATAARLKKEKSKKNKKKKNGTNAAFAAYEDYEDDSDACY